MQLLFERQSIDIMDKEIFFVGKLEPDTNRFLWL